jgi:mannosyltransferase
MTRPERTGGQLAAAECTDVVKCLGDAPRLWVVRLGHLDDPLRGLDGRKEQVLRERYQVTQVWRPTGLTLALVTQKPHR